MGGGVDNRLFVQTQPNMPGVWILSTQIITPAGRPASSEPATQACAGNTSTTKTCDAYLASLHLRQTMTYQPASRYWAHQWYETAIYLALALILAGLCFLRTRPGRFAEPDIHRPRASRPAQRSKGSRDRGRSQRTGEPPLAHTMTISRRHTQTRPTTQPAL
jgi:hypothetical protein